MSNSGNKRLMGVSSPILGAVNFISTTINIKPKNMKPEQFHY
jgi:hypothetical protein